MPDRPFDPRDFTAFQNDTLRRLRELERNVLRLPDSADALQTYESGSPLGDTRFLDFGANLRAVLVGDDYVQVDATAAGEGGWDAIVDGTIGTSNPEQRLFLGIGEALTYLHTTLGQTGRALVLVRSHPTNFTGSDQPTGNTYVETSNITIPSHTCLVSSDWLFAGGASASGYASTLPRWDHDGYTITIATGAGGGTITCIGMVINGKEQGVSGVNKSSLFTGASSVANAIFIDCALEPGTMTASAGRYLPVPNTTGAAYAYRCRWTNGWFAMSTAYDCDFNVPVGTYNPFLSATTNVMSRCTARVNGGGSGSTATWTLTAIRTIVIDLLDTLAGGGSGNTLTLQLGGLNCGYYIRNNGCSWLSVTNPTDTVVADIGGKFFDSITLGAPSTNRGHTVNVEASAIGGPLDITGPANVDITAIGTMTLRGESISGVITTRHTSSSGQAVNFVNCDQAALVVSGTPRLPSTGTHKPYAFDASSANNCIIFTGRSLYAAAGTDAGTNNRVLPEGTVASAPGDADYLVGTANAGLTSEIVAGPTPGGELGGTWASPTVDTTHSGSAHGVAVEDEGAAQGQALTQNFVGAGVTAAVAGSVATITIPGGGGSGDEPSVTDWLF